MQKGDIVGTWRGAGQKNFRADGTLASENGADAPGYLLYTPEGHVMVLATDPRGVATGDPAKLTVEEKAKAAEGCVAYFGTFELRGDDVLHGASGAVRFVLVGIVGCQNGHQLP